jgi:hypothetical protein
MEAISNSRTKPVTREARVKIDTTEAERRRLTVGECSGHFLTDPQGHGCGGDWRAGPSWRSFRGTGHPLQVC